MKKPSFVFIPVISPYATEMTYHSFGELGKAKSKGNPLEVTSDFDVTLHKGTVYYSLITLKTQYILFPKNYNKYAKVIFQSLYELPKELRYAKLSESQFLELINHHRSEVEKEIDGLPINFANGETYTLTKGHFLSEHLILKSFLLKQGQFEKLDES